jgi:hypothetical protein
MDAKRKEYIAEFGFDQTEDTEFFALNNPCQGSELVIKYIYESHRTDKYRFSAYVTGIYENRGHPQIGKRIFTSGSKDMPLWILKIALREAPEWFGENA